MAMHVFFDIYEILGFHIYFSRQTILFEELKTQQRCWFFKVFPTILPDTNSLHLKMDVSEYDCFLLGQKAYFQGRLLVCR